MSLDDWVEPARDVVDTEVRAYVSSLVNAVGGPGVDEPSKYVLGDDAIGCLRDLRRWLRFYDEKLERLDVQRVLAETNFVQGDLLRMLAEWSNDETTTGFRAKVSLLCLELLVPLTWTLEIEDQKTTVHHHKHLPYLKMAQVKYKRAILQHESHNILQQIIRIAVPSMAEPKADRSVRDNGIIRLALYAIRNLAMISQPENLPADGDEADVSRSTTIDVFAQQHVFPFLLTVASSMGEEYDVQDVIVLEVLFHLIKGVDPTAIFFTDEEQTQSKTNDLRNLLDKEKAMLAGYKKHAPTRHSRFGTMVWLKKGDETISTISGQAVISGPNRGLKYLDQAKKWNRPKNTGRNKEEPSSANFDKQMFLSKSAQTQLRTFTEEFLDSSFNPLFTHIRKSIERDLDRVLDMHRMQFFYVISWFLRAECARRVSMKARRARKGKQKAGAAASEQDTESFSIVAGVLNQENFVLLNIFLTNSLDAKAWQPTNAGMKCFTQILLTVQQMEQSTSEDDQEIAENIQSRIFYEEQTHDLIARLARNYRDQGRGYLDAVTELVHVFTRMVEGYSKQNEDMHIRSRRRARRRQKTKKVDQGQSEEQGNDADNETEGDSDDDAREARFLASERKFNFEKFALRFATQSCVNTFVSLLKAYHDLTPEQLKRAHRFFYRLAFKQNLSTMLFRVDIINLLQNMVHGPQALSTESPLFKEWEEFARQIFRKLTKRLVGRPALMVELLFSKMSDSVFYLENGKEPEAKSSSRKELVDWEVKNDIDTEDRVSLVTEVLAAEGKTKELRWLKQQLNDAMTERRKWDEANSAPLSRQDSTAVPDEDAVLPDAQPNDSNELGDNTPPTIIITPEGEKGVFRNAKFRLLLTLLGIEHRDDQAFDSQAVRQYKLSAEITAAKLAIAISDIERGEGGDVLDKYPHINKPAATFLRRKRTATRRERERSGGEGGEDANNNNNNNTNDGFIVSDGKNIDAGSSDSEADLDALLRNLQPPGQRTSSPSSTKRHTKSKGHRRRRQETMAETLALSRRKAQLERMRKIKSSALILAQDDESDEERDREFFAREAALRAELKGQRAGGEMVVVERRRKKKRTSSSAAESSGGDEQDQDEEDDRGDAMVVHKRRKLDDESGEASGGADAEDTVMFDSDDASEDEVAGDEVAVAATMTLPTMPKSRGGFLIEESESE